MTIENWIMIEGKKSILPSVIRKFYENLPSYCDQCLRLGHSWNSYLVQNPNINDKVAHHKQEVIQNLTWLKSSHIEARLKYVTINSSLNDTLNQSPPTSGNYSISHCSGIKW